MSDFFITEKKSRQIWSTLIDKNHIRIIMKTKKVAKRFSIRQKLFGIVFSLLNSKNIWQYITQQNCAGERGVLQEVDSIKKVESTLFCFMLNCHFLS